MSLVGQLIGPVTGLLDKFIPDADTKNKLAHEIATMSEKHGQQIALEQIEVLKLDAQRQLVPIKLASSSRLHLCAGAYGQLSSCSDCSGVRRCYPSSGCWCNDAFTSWHVGSRRCQILRKGQRCW